MDIAILEKEIKRITPRLCHIWGADNVYCLPLSVFQLKGKHCQKTHCRDGVVDTFGPCLLSINVLRGHSITKWTKREGVSRNSLLGHVTKGPLVHSRGNGVKIR